LPIYEYLCNDCGNNFESFIGIKDAPVKVCMHCNSSNIKKLVSNCSFQLKGTGWYATDYAKKDASNGNKKEKPKAESSKASEAKDSVKPAESKNTPDKKDAGKAA
jgi:putative FmdB family regulatory protein